MAAECWADVHHGTPRCLLGLFDAEAERWSTEVRRLSCDDLAALNEGSTREIPATEHRRLYQEEGDFVR
jgi:hypothetical protein